MRPTQTFSLSFEEVGWELMIFDFWFSKFWSSKWKKDVGQNSLYPAVEREGHLEKKIIERRICWGKRTLREKKIEKKKHWEWNILRGEDIERGRYWEGEILKFEKGKHWQKRIFSGEDIKKECSPPSRLHRVDSMYRPRATVIEQPFQSNSLRATASEQLSK